MLIPIFSIALYDIFYSVSGKGGMLRDQAQYTDILSKAQQHLLSLTVEIQIKNG